MKSLAKQLLEEIDSIKEDVNQSIQQGMDSVPDQTEDGGSNPTEDALKEIYDHAEDDAQLA